MVAATERHGGETEAPSPAPLPRIDRLLWNSVSRLALAVGLGLVGLAALPAESWAQCVPAGGSNFVCSGANTAGQSINLDDAAVTTTPGFNVTLGGTTQALDISGAGAISYIDHNASPLTAPSGAGLYVESTGDNGPTLGSVIIQTGGIVNAYSYGIQVENTGGGVTSVTATGAVTGLLNRGISVFGAGTMVEVNATSVTGGTNGIQAFNDGTGITGVVAAGTVQGVTRGISATNVVTATNLSVGAVDVTGGVLGIYAENRGTGATSVTASGTVVGTQTYGILAANGAVTLNPDGTVNAVAPSAGTNLTVNTASVTGGVGGIYAHNRGTGATNISASGAVSGGAHGGIFASNGATAGGLALNTAAVTGGTYGILAENGGAGVTSVTASGAVTGTAGSGIYVSNRVVVPDPATTTLIVNSATVTGGANGIYTENMGVGSTSIIASGPVTGTTGNGIDAYNADTALTISAAAVTGAVNGIVARNDGSAATSVTAAGMVTGSTGDGIYALTRGTAADPVTPILMISAASLSGGVNGIYADNQGQGATHVSATGPVAGISGDGIHAFNNAMATDLIIDAVAVAGGTNGISALNNGTGATSVTTSGLVEGGVSAISAISAGQPITITTGGLVRNLSQLSTSLAVMATGGPVALTNNGGLLGTVQFGAGAGLMTNNATWNTAGGVNDFGGGANQLVNATGVAVIAATNGSVVETTGFNNLANFNNHGMFIMADGGAGDRATASGNARFEAGSVYAVDIDGAGQSDRFTVNGTGTLLAGSTLAVNVQGGLSFGSRYTVLTADGGLTGQFGSVTGLPPATAFLTIEDTYDAHSAYLEVIKFRNFADAGLTPNQQSTGRGLDTIPTAGPLINAVAGLTTDAQARAAFDQLSGELHASATTALIEDSRFVRTAGIDRLRAAFDAVGAPSSPAMAYASAGPVPVPATFDRFAIWGQGFGSWGHTDSDGNAARLNRSTAGFLVGGDAPILETWRVGMLAGYSRSSFDVRDRASSGGSDNYHLGIYGGSQWGRLGFRAGAAYTWHDISTSRTVAFPGFADRLTADYHAGTAQLFGDLGYRIDLARLALEPFANVAYIDLHTGGFTERGGAAALTSRSVENSVTFTTLGLRASTDFALGGTSATARGALGWRHALGDTTPFSIFAFAGGSAFAIAGAPIAQDAVLVEAGLDLRVTSKATLGLSYGGQFGSHAHDQSFKANLGVRF